MVDKHVSGKRIIHAPHGSERSCKGWHQEAAMRMLMNNLDPDVAENPEQLVVYGGTGRAARSWEAFDAIVRSLRELENDETLLVQSGKPVGKFRTHDEAPRVLIANSNLVGQWNNYREFNFSLVRWKVCGCPPGNCKAENCCRRCDGSNQRPRRLERLCTARNVARGCARFAP